MNNTTNLGNVEDSYYHDTVSSAYDGGIWIFKGIFYKLTPVTIPLCIIVLVQNTVLFMDYYKERTKLVPSFFMGIALADILKAQGEIVLSVISILVYTGVCDVEVLYWSLLYYMTTALPGVNCSKVFNLALNLTLTVNIVDPFRRIDNARVKRIVVTICLIVTCLHFLDAICFAIDRCILFKYDLDFVLLLYAFSSPGLVTILTLFFLHSLQTNDEGQHHQISCFNNGGNMAPIIINRGTTGAAIVYISSFAYLIIPPLIVLVCMLIQIKYLRRTLGDTEASPLLPNPTRHVTNTVLMVSLLYFTCNAAFFVIIVYLSACNAAKHYEYSDQDYVNIGILQGVAEFILPLIYAAVYPVILLCRKPDLRERYRRGYQRILACCLRDSSANPRVRRPA